MQLPLITKVDKKSTRYLLCDKMKISIIVISSAVSAVHIYYFLIEKSDNAALSKLIMTIH